MHDRSPATRKLAEKGQRDDALAAARATGDDDDCLGIASTRRLGRVQHQIVGKPLLVEQHELLAFPDLIGGDRE